MHTVTRKVACFCEKSFEAAVPEDVDLAVDAGVEAEILAGDFMAVTCPACGKRLTPEFPCVVRAASPIPGAGEARDILLLPEPDRVACVSGRHPGLAAGHARVVVGMTELAEKLLLFGSSLDDRIVEIMKYYLLTGSAGGSAADSEVVLRYAGDEGDRMIFHISGLAEGRIGVARLGKDVYRKIEADLDTRLAEEPFVAFCEPPYVSLRKAEPSE
jgi:hypothetical protein